MSAEDSASRSQELKQAIVDDWDARAEKWEAWAPVVDDWFSPATALLLEQLEARPGHRVLELAAGSGGFTRYLAGAVGPEGRVLATDTSPNMVKLAARNALSQGLSNVTARVMDGEHPDVAWASMDGIACRQGVMFFAEPQEAFERLLPVLRPGGRLSVSVFTTGDRNGFLSVPGGILFRWAEPEGKAPPPAGGPGPFSLGRAGQLEGILEKAGYEDLRAKAVSCALKMPTVEDLLRFYQEIVGQLVKDLPPAQQEAAWAEVRASSARFVGPGASAPSEVLVASGRRPLIRRSA